MTHPIAEGSIYKLRIRAHNARGYSEWSNTLRAGVIAKPTVPTTISRVEIASTRTQIALSWTRVADATGDAGIITGYRLYMAIGDAGSYNLIYDGKGYPKINNKIISG